MSGAKCKPSAEVMTLQRRAIVVTVYFHTRCIRACVRFIAGKLRVNHGARVGRDTRAESTFGKFGSPKYLSPTLPPAPLSLFLGAKDGGGKGFSGAVPRIHEAARRCLRGLCVYLPTYIGGFLPAGLPPAESRGE